MNRKSLIFQHLLIYIFLLLGGHYGHFVYGETRAPRGMLRMSDDRQETIAAYGAIQTGDLLISELLANPKPGGVDFLEIYNRSGKTIDLAGVSVARVNSSGVVGAAQAVSERRLLISPGEYKVLTRQPEVVKQQYPHADLSTFVEMAKLPDFNNDVGGVVIYSLTTMIDSLFYMPDIWSPFLTSNHGVSLERRDFSKGIARNDNFLSAAIAVGGATPGYQNSQFVDTPVGNVVFLTSRTFSPDNDGFEDELAINYRVAESGYMANIDIYTDKGRLVRKLLRNQSIPTEGVIYWDGLSDANTQLPIGVYIAVIEFYNTLGVRKVYREGIVLAARL